MQYRAIKWEVLPNPLRPEEKTIGLITFNRPETLNAVDVRMRVFELGGEVFTHPFEVISARLLVERDLLDAPVTGRHIEVAVLARDRLRRELVDLPVDRAAGEPRGSPDEPALCSGNPGHSPL